MARPEPRRKITAEVVKSKAKKLSWWIAILGAAGTVATLGGRAIWAWWAFEDRVEMKIDARIAGQLDARMAVHEAAGHPRAVSKDTVKALEGRVDRVQSTQREIGERVTKIEQSVEVTERGVRRLLESRGLPAPRRKPRRPIATEPQTKGR